MHLIRAMNQFITLQLLRNADPQRDISNIVTLLHSCTAYTCEFLLAAVSYTLLQVLKLVFHFLILPLCLLTLPPEKIKHTHKENAS